MPNGLSVTEKDGTIRNQIRIKWRENPAIQTFKSLSVIPFESLPEEPLSHSMMPDSYYLEDDKPVFFGHYWMRGIPSIRHPRAVCLDYSVALPDGALCAYRYQGEIDAQSDHLVWVSNS